MNAVSSWLDSMQAPDKLASTLRSRAPQAAVWVLALALGVQAAIIVTRFAGAERAAMPVAQPPVALPASSQLDIAGITNAHLFGAAPAPVPTGNANNAPRTSMALVLTGTIAVNNASDGLAILGPNPATVQVYAVGDNVPGGARLHAVYRDRVLLERNGSLESLMLPRELSAGRPPPAASPPSYAADRVRQLITANPGAIANVIRPQPVFAGGRQKGYRVYPGRDRQAFLQLGLRPGDLVTAINNTPLDDPARSEEIFSTLASSSEARVTVMRNGRQQDFTLNMSQVAAEADQLSGADAGTNGSGDTAPPGAGPPPMASPRPPPGRN